MNNTSQHFSGDAALDRLSQLTGYTCEEHATGSVFVYENKDGIPDVTDLRGKFESLAANSSHQNLDELRKILAGYSQTSLILVDAGNTDGDAFKYIYHIGQMSGTEIQENPLEYHNQRTNRAKGPGL